MEAILKSAKNDLLPWNYGWPVCMLDYKHFVRPILTRCSTRYFSSLLLKGMLKWWNNNFFSYLIRQFRCFNTRNLLQSLTDNYIFKIKYLSLFRIFFGGGFPPETITFDVLRIKHVDYIIIIPYLLSLRLEEFKLRGFVIW